jgi:CheY-like chemotaxis protein
MRRLEPSPIDSPAETNQVADGAPTGQPFREKLGVLVVEDDHMVRILVQLGLERCGFNVWLASNGPEAIQLYRTHQNGIGVVLLDVCMPGMDGPATLQALRKLNPEVRACFMTGGMGAYEAEELLRRGAAFVIAKPFLLNELANVLRILAQRVSANPLPAASGCKG